MNRGGGHGTTRGLFEQHMGTRVPCQGPRLCHGGLESEAEGTRVRRGRENCVAGREGVCRPW
jgi:hypothetical protein